MDFYGYVNGSWWNQLPNFWWPEDRAYRVASDMDYFDTFIGGTQPCVQAVLELPGLEALAIGSEDRLDYAAARHP